MIHYDETKLIAANTVCESIKRKFNLSHMFIRLNMMNDDINIELCHAETTKDVLNAIQAELGKIYGGSYSVMPTPILSGSYVDNPIHKTTALYRFHKEN